MKGEILAEKAVRFVRTFDAPAEKIWAFLTDSKLLPQWYGEGVIEPREGGAVSLMGGHVRGVVTGWHPQKFLGYTWNVFSPGEEESRFPVSYLEFTLEGSRLTLVHRPIPAAMQNQTMMGWHTMLDLIQAGLAGNFPKRSDLFPKNAERYGVDISNLKGDAMSEFGIRVDDATVRFERLLPGPIEKVWAYLADSDKRAEWFTSGALPAVGESFEMTFHHADYSPHKSPPPPGYENVDREPQKMTSTLLALEPPHRLAFTFGKPIADDQYTEVDIRLTPQSDGKVKLTLTHSKLPDRKYALNISGGWHSHLAMLQHKAEGRVPPSIWDVWRQLQGAYDKRYG